MSNKIVKVVIGLPVEGPFDYWVPEDFRDAIRVGTRVRVPFGGRKHIGYVIGLTDKSRFPQSKLKLIAAVIDTTPLINEEILNLTQATAQYYGCAWGEVIETSLPKALRTGTMINFSVKQHPLPKTVGVSETVLVHDVSRKKSWDYLSDQIRKTIALGQGVIVLVPEIASIPFIEEILKKSISEKAMVLGRESNVKAELESWAMIRGGQVRIVVGTRSAVFCPIQNLGLIIVWDEDHQAYKQEQSPFYHGRDVALRRGQMSGARIILVSALPSPEVWWPASQTRKEIFFYDADKSVPIQLVDVTDYRSRKMVQISVPLRNTMEQTIKKGGKIVLFLNRKGFSTMTRCHQCQYTLQCPRCASNLAYLFAVKKMACSHCNYTMVPPSVCPQCQSSYLRFSGVGIEKLESEIARIFPQSRLKSYDKDTPGIPSNFDILIATQAVLKLQDQIAVDLVGAMYIDSELNRPDFRSAHKTFALLIQLRQMAREKLIVQTRLADNDCLKFAVKMDFQKFYSKEIKLRRELKLPPFNHLISIIVRAANEQAAFDQANMLYRQFDDKNKRKSIMVSEPQPDAIPKLRGKYRFMILVKGKSAEKILTFVRAALKGIKRKSGALISVNVDP